MNMRCDIAQITADSIILDYDVRTYTKLGNITK